MNVVIHSFPKNIFGAKDVGVKRHCNHRQAGDRTRRVARIDLLADFVKLCFFSASFHFFKKCPSGTDGGRTADLKVDTTASESRKNTQVVNKKTRENFYLYRGVTTRSFPWCLVQSTESTFAFLITLQCGLFSSNPHFITLLFLTHRGKAFAAPQMTFQSQ